MSAEYNNLYMVVSVSLPYHTLATVIFFVVLCGGVVWCDVHACVCVFVRALYLCFYLFTEWKLWGTSLGWFWVRAVLQLVLDAMYKMTSHSRTHTKEKRFQRCRLLYYYFSVKSKANSIEKKSTHTSKKFTSSSQQQRQQRVSVSIATVITWYYYSIKLFFFPLALLINFCCCERVYVLLLLEPNSCTKYWYTYRVYFTHWTILWFEWYGILYYSIKKKDL